MGFLLKVSETKENFEDMIGKPVTFANDIISIGGQIIHAKGEKAFISDVEYTAGHWSKPCPDIYIHPKINTIKINGIENSCWKLETFIEYNRCLTKKLKL